MPEGDSLHRAAQRLQVLVGERVEVETPNPRAAVKGLAERLDGRVLESVEAVGKNLLLHLEGGVVLRSHLRMTGRWRVYRRGAARRSGGLGPWLVLRGREWEAAQWNGPVLTIAGAGRVRRLGPDVLAPSFDPAAAAVRVREGAGDERCLGEALQDQRLVAGIGNMWMAEAAWEAQVSPWLSLRAVTDDELRGVLAAAQRLMRESVERGRGGGSAGHAGGDGRGRARRREVYRRAGMPCRRCGAVLRSRGQGEANRTAYWCPGCQRGPDPPQAPVVGAGSG
jgi:endonuclease-8